MEQFIRHLHRKGVLLWMGDTGLRYRAPRGVLTAEERQVLSRANEEIASLLQQDSRSPDPPASLGPRADVRRAPLSFTQLDLWYARLRCGGRPIRHIAAEFRLQGPVRIDLLKESVVAVGRRHDALRTRIVLSNGTFPVQEVADSYRSDLEVIQLGQVPEVERRAEIELQVRRAILEADDYAVSPLFKPLLIMTETSEQVLILALDHMISDLASLYLLSEEVFTAYAQLLEQRPIELPQVSIQFPEYAVRVRAQPIEMLTRVWRRLDSIGSTRFPHRVQRGVSGEKADFGSVQFVIDGDLYEELRVWVRRHRTTVALATFTAYAALVLRWCRVREAVIQFMTDGRTSVELERTIGYLAFGIYIRVALGARDTFIDMLKAVTEEYCRGGDEADFGYGLAHVARSEFVHTTSVNWLPGRRSASVDFRPDMKVSLARLPLDFADIVLQGEVNEDQEPGVSFSDQDGAIIGQIGYARGAFPDESMKRFAINIRRFVMAMIRTPTQLVVEVELN